MKKLDNGKFACSKCGKEFEKEGWCRQHEARTHEEENSKPESTKKEEKPSCAKCPDCGGALRLLNTKDMYERKAASLGFTKICIKCEELIK
jgi:hypothetical protein